MTRGSKFRVLVGVALCLAAAGSVAAGMLKSANVPVTVAKSVLTVTPDRAWNKMGRPGKLAESWTLDGLALNDLTFYGGIADGATLFRDVDKKNRPLPRFSKTMLAPDIIQVFESSYRVAAGTSLMTITAVEPTPFLGANGFRFTYDFVMGDEVKRKGEGRGAIVGDRLYMITFEAPVIHYFNRDIVAFRSIVDSARLVAAKKK